MEMVTLIPDEALAALRDEMGAEFEQLGKTERLAVVTAWTEGCVTHRRLKELTKDHPHDLTTKLHSLVDRGLLVSDGSTRNTFYFLPGRHPIYDADLGVSAVPPSLASNSLHNGSNSLHNDIATTSEDGRKASQNRKLHKAAAPVANKRRAAPTTVRTVIQNLCSIRELSIQELAGLLKRNEETLGTRYVRPMCKEGVLVRKFPNILNHPNQKYKADKKASG